MTLVDPERKVLAMADPYDDRVESLTEREMEVLRLVAEGCANQQIADELVVVRDTIKKHVSSILRKLGAANRTQSVARARALGVLD